MSKWELDQADANYYGDVERGGVFVAADVDDTTLSRAEVENAFRRFNGRFAAAR